ncbi:MAG TPA: hypothetical protein VK762_37560 [Polyangiaceae bacterium]|nr:hypothetical protein [Polyangiaceae bacterium]
MAAVLLPVLCACGSPGGEEVGETASALGGIAFVQVSSSTPQASLSSVATTYGNAQSAGDTNIVPVCWFDASSSVTGVSDTSHNAYAVAAPVVRLSGTASCTMYYAANIKAAAAGANVVTVTFSNSVLDPDVRISEYGGLSTSPLDVSAGATGNGNTASSGTATTTAAGDLIVGADYLQSVTNGPGPGFTGRVITQPDSDILEDEVAGAPGAYSASVPTGGGWWIMQMAAFKAASVVDAGAGGGVHDAATGMDAGGVATKDSGPDAHVDAGFDSGSSGGSSGGTDASMGSGGSGPGGPATLVQHVSGSNLRGNSMASPYCYYVELPAPATGGNAIVVGATWKGSATLEVTDDHSDHYAVNEAFYDSSDGQSVGIASAFGVAAGARKLSVCFSANPGGWVQPMVTELADVVAIDGAGSGGNGSGTTATAGSLSPRGSDLLYQVVYTPGGPPSQFAAGSGNTLLSADSRDGWAGQLGTGAASMALGSGTHWASAAVLLRAGAAGSVPSGMRIVRAMHNNVPSGAPAGGNGAFPNPLTLQAPSSGNLLVALVAGGCGCSVVPKVTGMTDSSGNAWSGTKTEAGGDAISQLYYAGSAVTSGSLQLSLSWSYTGSDETVIVYDIVGASSAPFDVSAGGSGTSNGGNLTLPFTITPAGAGELVFVATPWDFDTAGGLMGGLIDTMTTSGESQDGPFPIDENNGWGHAVSTSTSPIQFTWVPLFNGEFGNYSAVAAAFKPAH